MKKLFLAFLAVGSLASAQAQKAGSILLYGNAGVITNRDLNDIPSSIGPDVETRTTQWNVSPGVGFQFNKNWTVGASFGIGGSRVSIDNNVAGGDVVNTYRELAVGPFIRYTMPFSKTFFAFHQLDLQYLNARTTAEIPNAPDLEDRADGFQVGLTPALGININSCIALNFGIGGIGYRTLVTDFDDATAGENRSNTFFITFGQQFHWGVSANLGGYKHMRGHGHGEPGMENRRMNAYDEDDNEDMPKRKKKTNADDEE